MLRQIGTLLEWRMRIAASEMQKARNKNTFTAFCSQRVNQRWLAVNKTL